MLAVIVGCGRVGANLAVYLAGAGHDVVVIDKDPSAFNNLGSTFNGITVTGTGIDEDVLRKANIEKANAFAAVTSSDSVNIMAAQVAQKIFGVPRVVARTNQPGRESIFHELGIVTACPTDLGAAAIQSMLLTTGMQTKYTLGAGEVQVVDAVIPDDTKSLTPAGLDIPGKVRVCAVVRNGIAKVPEPDFLLLPGDQLTIAARLDSLETLWGMLNPRLDENRHPGGPWKWRSGGDHGNRGEARE